MTLLFYNSGGVLAIRRLGELITSSTAPNAAKSPSKRRAVLGEADRRISSNAPSPPKNERNDLIDDADSSDGDPASV